MYNGFRNVHLALGLLTSAFLLAYGISALQMAHPPLFRWLKTARIESRIELPPLESPRAIAKHLMDAHDLRGDLMETETTSVAVRLRIVRPGVVHNVKIDPATRIAVVSTEKSDFIGTLNRIHHVSGLWHEYWVTNAWSWFLALVSIALFGTGITGLYLWLKRTADRKIGLWLIAVSLVWGGTLLVLVRLG